MERKFYRKGVTADPSTVANSTNVVWVHFKEPVRGGTDFFFGSIRAIFAVFNPPEIGAGPHDLYTAIETGVDTGICSIKRAPVVRVKNR